MRKWSFLFFLFQVWSVYGHEYHFRILPSDFTEDIQQINLLFQSSDKLMWLGTDKGLFSFDGKKYKYFPRQDRLQQKVTAISESKDGQIWAGYEDGQIQITHFQGVGKRLVLDSIHDFAISKIVFLEHQDVMITTYGQGLWQLHAGQPQRIRYGALDEITDFYDAMLDTKGQIWLATDDGIWIYHPYPFPGLYHIGRLQGLQDDIITRLTLGQQGNVLIGMYDFGTAQYDVLNREVQELRRFMPGDGSVVSVVHGYGSDLWMATEKAIWYSSATVPSHPITLPFVLKNRIECILFDVSGNLWMASGNRLYIANTQIEYIRPQLTGIQTILSTNHELWYGCQDGLFSTDREGKQLMSYLGNENINVLCLYKDSTNLLWIGTFGQGLYIFDPVSKRVKHLTERERLSNTSILNIDGRGNRVWLATLGGIIQIEWNKDPFESSLTLTELQDQFQSPPGYVYDVFVSTQGKVWFGTDGKGLFYLDHGGIHSFPVSFMENDSTLVQVKTIYSITEDWEHRLWISTAKGLVLCVDDHGNVLNSVLSPNSALNSVALTGAEEILMIGEGSIQTLNTRDKIFWLDESSGLTSFTPNINATSIDHDGSVWIADTD